MKLFSTIALALICIGSYAQSTQKTVEELLKTSGSTAQLRQLDEVINSKIEGSKNKFPKAEDFNKFSSIMKSALNSNDAEKYYIEYFKLKTSEDSLKKVIALYNNPMLQEFNKIELDASSAAKQQEQTAFFQNLQSNPPAQSRIQLLARLNEDLGATEVTMAMIKTMIASMIKGVNSFQPKEKQLSEVEINASINSALPANYEQQLSNQLVAMSLFTYKDVSEEKLAQYVGIWETPLGKYFMNHTFGALSYSFSKMSEKMGSSFKEFDKNR